MSSAFCAVAGEKIQAKAWMATRSALEYPEYRDQDGLCQGNFKVHVEVFTEYGHKIRNDLIINVGDEWRDLDAKVSNCGCYKESLLGRLSRKIRNKSI